MALKSREPWVAIFYYFGETSMSDNTTDKNYHNQLEAKAKTADSAERREDYMVLLLAAITVTLVSTGVIGPTFFKSLFF